MTWLADVQKDRPTGAALEKELAKREKLVNELKLLNQRTGLHKSNAAKQGHLEDMTNLAKKIASIDKKLGRS